MLVATATVWTGYHHCPTITPTVNSTTTDRGTVRAETGRTTNEEEEIRTILIYDDDDDDNDDDDILLHYPSSSLGGVVVVGVYGKECMRRHHTQIRFLFYYQ